MTSAGRSAVPKRVWQLVAAAALALASGAMPGVAPETASAEAPGCALELILAVDVSGSIDSREFDLQTTGLAEAFEHPSLVNAISNIEGGIVVTVTQWSGTNRQRQMTNWYRLTDAGSMAGFADAVRRALHP